MAMRAMYFTIFLAQSYLYPLRSNTLKTKVVERLFFPENKGELHFWCWLPVPGKRVRSMFPSKGVVALLLLCWVTLLGCSPDRTMFPRDATS